MKSVVSILAIMFTSLSGYSQDCYVFGLTLFSGNIYHVVQFDIETGQYISVAALPPNITVETDVTAFDKTNKKYLVRGVSNLDDVLFVADVVSGGVTTLPAPSNLWALEFDDNTGTLYGYLYPKIVSVNLNTGAANNVLDLAPYINDINPVTHTFDALNGIYICEGYDLNWNEWIYAFDLVNGTVDLRQIPPGGMKAIEYDDDTQTLYGITVPGSSSQLFALSFSTGSLSTVGTISNVVGMNDDSYTFDDDNKSLIAVGNSGNGNKLYVATINPFGSNIAGGYPPSGLWGIQFAGCGIGFPTSVSEINTKIPVDVYPNPARDHITVKGLQEPSEFKLYDLVGRQVLSTAVSQDQRISVKHLDSGIYFYTIGQQTGKLIIE